MNALESMAGVIAIGGFFCIMALCYYLVTRYGQKQENPLWKSVFALKKLISNLNGRKAEINKLIARGKKEIKKTAVNIEDFQGFHLKCHDKKEMDLAILIMSKIQFLKKHLEEEQALVKELQSCIQMIEDKRKGLQLKRDLFVEFLKKVSKNVHTGDPLDLDINSDYMRAIDSLLERAKQHQKLLKESPDILSRSYTEAEIAP